MFRPFLPGMLLGLACSVVVSTGVWAGPTLHLIYADPAGSPMDAGARVFKAEVEKLTAGAIHVEVLPGGTLHGEKIGELDMLRRTRSDDVDMCIVATAPLTNFSKPMEILDMPFLFKDYKDVYRMLDGKVGRTLLHGVQGTGLQGLEFMDCGFRILTCNSPIKSLHDLQNKRVRIMQSPVYYDFIKLIGAIPVPSAFDKINEMAQKGYIDVADRSFTTWWEYGLNKFQRYILESNHAYAAEPLLINEKLFRSLPASQQAQVQAAARSARDAERRLFREEESKVKARCAQQGIPIFQLTDADRQTMQKDSAPIVQRLQRQYPVLMKQALP